MEKLFFLRIKTAGFLVSQGKVEQIAQNFKPI